MTRSWLLVFAIACGPSPRGDQHPDGAPGGDGGAVDLCHVQSDDNGVPNCTQHAPPDSFDPDIQWMWTGPDGDTNSEVTPLVANLTDDNGDGSIDLCDVPDVVVVAFPPLHMGALIGHIYLLDGKTGQQELEIPTGVDPFMTPAIGDLDHDGVPDIVTSDNEGHLIAFDHTGHVMWGPADSAGQSSAIALADLDHDGKVEILSGNSVYDDHGHKQWTASTPPARQGATVAADLDGDGYMEVVLGNAAYHHDGTPYWQTTLGAGYPQVADLMGGPEPEVLLTNDDGL